jgi:hypothetical protein
VTEHFSAAQWVDLVRGLTPEVQAEPMMRHLHDGCAECWEAYRDWQRLASFGEAEQGKEPPNEAVAAAKDYMSDYAAPPPDDTPRVDPQVWMSAQRPRLVFDSMHDATPGMRAAVAAPRHLLYEAKPFLVDLLVEQDNRTRRLSLAGQVVDINDANHLIRNLEITVGNAEEELAKARPNEYGEFHCEFERKAGLLLLIAIERHSPILIQVSL